MRFVVDHETLYRYSTPVRLAPHVLRLTPRPEHVRIESHTLAIEPSPDARREQLDPFGNRVTHVSFSGWSDLLRITNRLVLETFHVPPPPDVPGRLPCPLDPGDELRPYRGVVVDETVYAFAAAIADETGLAPVAFLDRLNANLHARIERAIRFSGEAQAPCVTLATGRGACRDITVLFVAACRSLGLPARFVSGYQARAATQSEQRHLHAWPEVFVAGAWHGWDPTHGSTVGNDHVALCAAPEQGPTMPVEGGFFANGVTATLDYDLRIATS
jgi:transglutaminase-like putative cysteine protease